ncbi:MAG: PAS domain-containing protein, partial [Ignavibacteria bacterium]|nr:PAS domain-containing protein [Ignavibacteria bacterium]
MSSYKYVVIVSLILAACSVVACVVIVSNNPRPASVAIPAGIAIITLAALAFAFWNIQSSLQKLTSSLKQQIPERLNPNEFPLLKPFVKTIINYAVNINERIKFLKSQNDEFELQLQLLGRQKQNTEAIIYSIRDVVIVTDASGRIIIANNAAEGLFGFKIKDSILKPLNEIIKHAQFVKLMTNSRQGEIAHVKHEIAFEGNNNIITFGCIISCVKDDKGHISGVVAVLHDMTKEKEISQMKNDFVSHVSHELKTPLASINAYAEMLVDGEAEDDQTMNQFCSIIQTQAQRLNRLIEDILNISRIESGLTKVSKDNLSLAIIIADAAEMIKSYAQEKNITIDTQMPIIFDQVYADKDMIIQVIINLL